MDAPAAPLVRAFDLAAFEGATGPDRQARTEDLDRICRETGFLVLAGHGVPEATIRGVWAAAQAFFAQPPEEKAKVAAKPGDPYGLARPRPRRPMAKSRGDETAPRPQGKLQRRPLTIPQGLSDPDAYAFCYVPIPGPTSPASARPGRPTTRPWRT
ncbi:2OG-Fe(II) oxygenase superfamily protein [Rubellimicrobium mesophilum DSM 19309]|uniref:2OG-Fe(II) oxygenase superfamily protein n=1 Tax=Rubellimicrobium mesophilum DSM 19309 TaxID=442562 RepID=A0A017HVW5_9RHOB|nr:2-oxoglutarate and iron-dependent oxygenase domain-containing protein [Rubellimicrobium mesophilum]EYD78313.1 2OG-Fe(II) oxygenase superfamily protein [Rubellimicrobium mesophilum DSM 19309]